jgi:hypothetical protein
MLEVLRHHQLSVTEYQAEMVEEECHQQRTTSMPQIFQACILTSMLGGLKDGLPAMMFACCLFNWSYC